MRPLLRAIALLLLLDAAAQAGALRQDARQLLTRRNLVMALFGLGVAGAAHAWDDDLKGELEGPHLLEASSDITNLYGASHFNRPASLGLWALGKTTRREKVECCSSCASKMVSRGDRHALLLLRPAISAAPVLLARTRKPGRSAPRN